MVGTDSARRGGILALALGAVLQYYDVFAELATTLF